MRILLFSGFLGSGKTTLILALTERLASLGLKACVVVNEIGEIGIDGPVLAGGGVDVREITAGCICCQIGSDLLVTLNDLAAHFAPDVVVIEASGIATPGGVLDALSVLAVPVDVTRCVTVVDPTRIEALLHVMEPLIESQLSGAGEVVISKVDECTQDELAFAREAAARVAPSATVHEVSAMEARSVAGFVESLLATLAQETANVPGDIP